MTKNNSYIAVDIAKDSLQVQAPDYACALPYDRSGLQKLHEIIKKQPEETILVCEATGGYERALIAFLREYKLPVALLNPARVRDFARSEGIKAKVQSNETLKVHSKIIQSVKGVGQVTAWSICAYLSEITQVNRAQLAALAGLAPYNQDSGKMKGKRRIQGGRQKVRDPLYMAATCAAVHNPHIKTYVDRLRLEKGKPYKCAITAAMRKILIHIQALLKNHQKQLV